ncbi:MAG: pyridoxal phosphate-dependent aminotransferase [Rikenellaceae bacterium]|jgi:aspartate/methionine/tyrosine aminotransferase|nr:pyridoxal phosphate-dependent aminotransferase [Rikenellaceae bacterium]
MDTNGVFDRALVERAVAELGITNLEHATIGQVVLLAMKLEAWTGIPFIRMDQGVPGLPPCRIGLEAEKAALDTGIAAIYPPAEGVPVLKAETSRFVKAFLNIDISPAACIPVTGSVCGSFGAFIACNQIDPAKDTVLFVDPGFPIQKSQLAMLGMKYASFDIHDHRGLVLRTRLEGFLEKGNISAIIYSNPNNPAWICLTENELQIIGGLASKYGAIVLEDLAYFGMDFREYLGHPWEPPYPATVARYTDNYILMFSGSKIFSYAGQRIAVTAVSDKIFGNVYPPLAERYGNSGHFGSTLINAIYYMVTSGSTHSTQFGLAAMMRAATDGEIDFVGETREYARRARRMKDIFLKNGFHIVYDKDEERPISDGFFFTVGYGRMSSAELMRELVYYGISSITLTTTGSEQPGIRACCSRMTEPMYAMLEERLVVFHKNHP